MGFLVCGEVVQAGFCAVAVKVSSGWIRGALECVRGLREWQEARLAGVVIPEGVGSRFHDRRARAGSRGRALRVFAALCLLAVSGGISRANSADRDAKF